MKVVRPLRFDRVRRATRNKKRRDRRQALTAKRKRLQRAINSMFWFGIEPELMWQTTDWTGNGANDNRKEDRRLTLSPVPRN
jgi:hypothetical protein